MKSCTVETDLWGLPRVRSGGFALTYKLTRPHHALAVRCFHRYVPDRTVRYAAIGSYLKSNPSEIFVPIQFLSQGVLVRGNWYPITYMKWVEGDTLEAYVMKNVKNQDKIRALTTEFLRVVAEIERLGIAHGDLSHRNLLVQQGKIILVDYDGMFVPALRGKKSCELGNIHFQLPARTEEHFDAGVDRFSEIVIYLALTALSQNPGLIDRYETGGEGLLFQREDFLNPYPSKLLQEMENLAGMKTLVSTFRRICTSEVSMVPRLADFLTARPLDLTRRERPVTSPSPFPVLDARLRYRLLARIGKKVTVVGRVMDIFRGVSKSGQPHVFLNFGHWRVKCFTIVLWDGALQLLEDLGKTPEAYLHQWVSVTGMLTEYEHRPQISINAPGILFCSKMRWMRCA